MLSAKVDKHGQWFDTPLPGRLSDVFGLKTNAFYELPATLKFQIAGSATDTKVHYYEVLEPSTATVVARFMNTPEHSPAVTMNKFGTGNAIYVATESNSSVLDSVLDYAYMISGVQRGPRTPEGVYARMVDGRTLYVNTTADLQRIPIAGVKKSMMNNRSFDGVLILGPMDSDLIQ